MDLLARSEQTPVPGSIDVYDKISDQPNAAMKDTLAKDAALGNLLVGKLTNIPLPVRPTGELKLYFDDTKLSDLWIAVSWSA